MISVMKVFNLIWNYLFQRMAGVFSFMVEKLKFAFNWEDPFITVTSLCVVFFLCSICTIVFLIESALPLWIARLPLLFPVLTLTIITEPWIQDNFWVPLTGVNLPVLWISLFSRTAITKQGLKRRTKESDPDPIGATIPSPSDDARRKPKLVVNAGVKDEVSIPHRITTLQKSADDNEVAKVDEPSKSRNFLNIDAIFFGGKTNKHQCTADPQTPASSREKGWITEIQSIKWPVLPKIFPFRKRSCIKSTHVRF